MRKSVLIILAITLSLVALGVSIIFILKFGFSPLPDTKGEWGSAGDYFGGFLNPIIGLINVLVLIYISLLVSKKDDQRWSNDMIHAAHEELLAEIAKIKVGSSRSAYDDLGMFLLGFTYRNRWLFGKKEDVFIKVVREYGKSLRAVSTSAMIINVDSIDINGQFTRIIKNDEGLIDFDLNLIKDHCMKFCINDECRLQLVNFLRATMMNRNIKQVISVDKTSAAKKTYDLFFETRKHHLKDE
jgi:uncharacterized membrane protein